MFDQSVVSRFWSQVSKPDGEDGCWFFGTTRNQSCFSDNGQRWLPHQFACVLFYGPIPEGLVVRHRCESRWCVNPEHMQLGTQQENMWDYQYRRRGLLAPGQLGGYEDVE